MGLEKKKRLVVEEERESLRFGRKKSLVVEEREFGKEEESDFEERDQEMWFLVEKRGRYDFGK